MTQIEKISLAYDITKVSNEIDTIQEIIQHTLSSLDKQKLTAQDLMAIQAKLIHLCESNMAVLKKIQEERIFEKAI